MAVAIGPASCAGPPPPDGVIRVDQVGYLPAETKTAVLLAPRDGSRARAAVVDDRGRTVLSPAIGASRGPWNAAYPAVHPIDLTALTRPGTYRLRISGPVTADSPPFRVGTGAALFGPLTAGSVTYFQAHRDGADQVAGPWKRPPAHLADRAAQVYTDPTFDDTGRLTGPLTRTGDHVDVEGGWYDAGDFLKFTHTTAYALIAMLLVQRDGPAPPGLAAETRHGIDWLDRMWDADTATLYTQVGVGSGAAAGLLGDHDTWRLPETDDGVAVEPDRGRYYQRYRPVFRAAAPGGRLSPNLAGRVAAAFALAAQVEAAADPARARGHLAAARQVFELAATADVGDLVTTEPRSYYPEESWADDLAVGATELARAGTLLGDPGAAGWARQATHWARLDADEHGTDALSVYDLSAVADAELGGLLATAPVEAAEIGVDELRADLRARLDAGVRAAAGNLLGAAAGDGGSDYAARELGYAATAALYRELTGDARYAGFGTAQRGVALGANGWGTSLVVGAGSSYPRCPHDQIAGLTPGAPELTGAVVNGPNAAARIEQLEADPASPSPCTAGDFARFNRAGTAYTDDERISASTEPAIDFTATGLLAFALTVRDG